jgi:hypothetical protein
MIYRFCLKYLTACYVLFILVLKKEQLVRYEELAVERRCTKQRYILLPECPGEHFPNHTPGMIRISNSTIASLY